MAMKKENIFVCPNFKKIFDEQLDKYRNPFPDEPRVKTHEEKLNHIYRRVRNVFKELEEKKRREMFNAVVAGKEVPSYELLINLEEVFRLQSQYLVDEVKKDLKNKKEGKKQYEQLEELEKEKQKALKVRLNISRNQLRNLLMKSFDGAKGKKINDGFGAYILKNKVIEDGCKLLINIAEWGCWHIEKGDFYQAGLELGRFAEGLWFSWYLYEVSKGNSEQINITEKEIKGHMLSLAIKGIDDEFYLKLDNGKKFRDSVHFNAILRKAYHEKYTIADDINPIIEICKTIIGHMLKRVQSKRKKGRSKKTQKIKS